MFKLSVIKFDDNEYLVNHYHKIPDAKFSNFAEVIRSVCLYARRAPELFEEEPILLHLSESEEKAIREIRNLILEQKVLN